MTQEEMEKVRVLLEERASKIDSIVRELESAMEVSWETLRLEFTI